MGLSVARDGLVIFYWAIVRKKLIALTRSQECWGLARPMGFRSQKHSARGVYSKEVIKASAKVLLQCHSCQGGTFLACIEYKVRRLGCFLDRLHHYLKHMYSPFPMLTMSVLREGFIRSLSCSAACSHVCTAARLPHMVYNPGTTRLGFMKAGARCRVKINSS